MKYTLPDYYIIEITSRCNFNCTICPHSFMPLSSLGDMSLSLFERILDQIATSAKVIQLYWMGEPLLNPNVFQMVNLCKIKTNAKVIISTNGSMLTEQSISSLVKNGLDEIVVSVDACDSQKIYSEIRTNGNIKLLNSNIELLLKNKGSMHVVLQFIDLFVNKEEREAFANKWKNADCDISFSCLYTWANQLPSLRLASDHLSPVQYKKRIPCEDLWNKMTINHAGLISICCFDWRLSNIIGNCTKDSLIDIWNGDIINKLRVLHKKGDFQKILLCKGCEAWAEPDEYKIMYNL